MRRLGRPDRLAAQRARVRRVLLRASGRPRRPRPGSSRPFPSSASAARVRGQRPRVPSMIRNTFTAPGQLREHRLQPAALRPGCGRERLALGLRFLRAVTSRDTPSIATSLPSASRIGTSTCSDHSHLPPRPRIADLVRRVPLGVGDRLEDQRQIVRVDARVEGVRVGVDLLRREPGVVARRRAQVVEALIGRDAKAEDHVVRVLDQHAVEPVSALELLEARAAAAR